MASTGDLIGGFLKGFAGARDRKRDRELEVKQEKLQREIMEAQLDALSRQQSANQSFAEMASGFQRKRIPEIQNFAEEGELGKFIQTGSRQIAQNPQGQPRSLTDMLTSSDPAIQSIMMQMSPQRAQQALQTGQMVQSQRTAQNEVQARQQLAAGAFQSGKTPQEFLNSQEGFALGLNAGFTPKQLMSDSTLDSLQAQIDLLNLRRDVFEFDQAAADAGREQDQRTESAREVLNIATEMSEILPRLEGTMLEPGSPGSEWIRRGLGAVPGAGALIGLSPEQAQQLRTDYEIFGKLANDLVISMQGRLSGVTDTRFNALAGSLPNYKIGSAANLYVVEETLRRGIPIARREGVPESELAVYQRVLDSLSGSRRASDTGEVPQEGEVMDGYIFKGGDPSDKTNWAPVVE